ncbi:hypothetical protein SEET0821_16064, partial [Salmonella enterica subsp. enterica serovar Tennessee str. TXSC_TXSC08-21]
HGKGELTELYGRMFLYSLLIPIEVSIPILLPLVICVVLELKVVLAPGLRDLLIGHFFNVNLLSQREEKIF